MIYTVTLMNPAGMSRRTVKVDVPDLGALKKMFAIDIKTAKERKVNEFMIFAVAVIPSTDIEEDGAGLLEVEEQDES